MFWVIMSFCSHSFRSSVAAEKSRWVRISSESLDVWASCWALIFVSNDCILTACLLNVISASNRLELHRRSWCEHNSNWFLLSAASWCAWVRFWLMLVWTSWWAVRLFFYFLKLFRHCKPIIFGLRLFVSACWEFTLAQFFMSTSRVVDPAPEPDPDPYWIRIQFCKSSCFEVLDDLFWELKASSITWISRRPRDR